MSREVEQIVLIEASYKNVSVLISDFPNKLLFLM